jgi:hypothetical protein
MKSTQVILINMISCFQNKSKTANTNDLSENCNYILIILQTTQFSYIIKLNNGQLN